MGLRHNVQDVIMTNKPVPPKPQLRSADYSLRNQVMLETLSMPQQQKTPGVTPLQLNVSPPGVNDLNRPMLINTTASRWRELGVGSTISRPKYQKRRMREPITREQLERQAMKEEELLAMSRLLQEATNGQDNKENIQALPRRLIPKEERGQIGTRRSRSEPMHLPPIDEGQTPPGFRKPSTPAYAQSRSRTGMSPGIHSDVMNKKRQGSASKTDSLNGLPKLSKVKEEKNRFVDNSFLRGVQRHTGQMNMNLTNIGRPPRVPRHSWEDNRAKSSMANNRHTQNQIPHNHPDLPPPCIADNETCEVPLRLRDMDLGSVFPIHKKMETVRQFHQEQFKKHLEQWKKNGNSEATDKHTEALELVAKYKQRESQFGDSVLHANSSQILNIKRDPSISDSNQNITKNKQEVNQNEIQQRPKTPIARRQRTVLPPPRTSQSNRETLNLKPPDESVPHKKISVENAGHTPRIPKSILDSDGKGIKPTKGAKRPPTDDEYVYKDAKTYIEDNNLLPPDKCRMIQDWVNHVDLTSDCSDCETDSSYDLTSNCSDDMFETDSEDVELDSAG